MFWCCSLTSISCFLKHPFYRFSFSLLFPAWGYRRNWTSGWQNNNCKYVPVYLIYNLLCVYFFVPLPSLLCCLRKHPLTVLWESRNLCFAVECKKVTPSSLCGSMTHFEKSLLHNIVVGCLTVLDYTFWAFTEEPSIAVSGTHPWWVLIWINTKYIKVFLEESGN